MLNLWRVLVLAMGLSCATTAQAADIFVASPMAPISDSTDYAGKDNPKAELKLAGARNGAFSGQVIVYLPEAAPGPAASISDLRLKGGDATIPAKAFEIRYALPTGAPSVAGKGDVSFDALVETPRDKAKTHPVWVTLNIPKDAKPGQYEGTFTVADRKIPVSVTVCDFTLPDPRDYVTWVDFVQSPETVAMQYKVPLWSDEHFKLVATCFEQLAKLGNKTLYIPLMCQTHFGNSESMVRWVKTDKPTEFTHDFSIAEKYLDTYIKVCGKPARVILYGYEGALGGSQGKTPQECRRGVPFTLVDPKTKEVTTGEGPTLNNENPAYPDYPADTIKFWKPVLEGMREILKKRGVVDGEIAFGLTPDLMPGKKTFENLKAGFPWLMWGSEAHGRRTAPVYSYSTIVWGGYFWRNPDPKGNRMYGWKRGPCVWAYFQRDIWKLPYAGQLAEARVLGEMNITGQQCGFGRMSADFWRVLEGAKGAKSTLVNRYPLSNWAQLTLRMTPYLYPGAKGACGSIRLEMLREGVQDCEARIAIEKVLIDKAKAPALGDLATSAQAVLDERPTTFTVKEFNAADFDWQAASVKLFNTAGEVAAKAK